METLLKIGEALKVLGEVSLALILWFVLAAFAIAGIGLLAQIFVGFIMAGTNMPSVVVN